MLTFDTLDARSQGSVTRFIIEHFLQELGEQLGPPDHWQVAAANHAIAAYQGGQFDRALQCILVGEMSPHQRPPSAQLTGEVEKLSLRSLWYRLLYPAPDFRIQAQIASAS